MGSPTSTPQTARIELDDLTERSQALIDAVGLRRKAEILQDDRRFVAPELRNRRFAVAGGIDLVILETPA